MFSLTNAAAQQIQQAAHQAQAKDMALRVAARRLPDGSLDYGMGFDEVGEGEGFKIRVAPSDRPGQLDRDEGVVAHRVRQSREPG